MTLRVSAGLALPVDVAGQAVAVLGKRGSGKTNTATVLVEELVRAGVQTVILDPVGAWWGLRSNAAGDGPGLEIPRLGGQHGDVPLEQTAGALIADVALQSRQSLLIDLSDFPTKAAIGRFVTDFAERLYRGKKSDSVLHLVLEEADMFAPQRVKGSERMQGAIEQIVRRGRSRGMGVTLITQRSAVLSKDVLTQADVLIVMRTTGPHDLRAIREWVDSRGDEHGAGVLDSLPSLATGEGWIWNPEHEILHRVQFRARETFDSSRTPKAGELREEPEQVAPIDIDSLGEKIRATAEKAKADDPAELRKKIRELQRVVDEKAPGARVEQVEKIVEVPVPVFNGEVEKLELLVDALIKATAPISEALAAIPIAVGEISQAVATAKGVRHEPRRVAEPDRRHQSTPRPPRPPRAQPRTPPAPPRDADTSGVTPAKQRILDALAALEAIGVDQAHKTQLALFAKASPKSSGYANNLGALRSAGLIDYPGPSLASLTEDGRAIADPGHVPTTSDELHGFVFSLVGPARSRILQTLIDDYPNWVSREELAERASASASSSGYANNLGSLRSLGLLEYPAGGQVIASSVLFID